MTQIIPVSDNQLTMSSIDIAYLCDKRHDHVMRDIRSMLDGLGITHPSFGGSYTDSTGRTLPCFNLPKRETLILVSGYRIDLRVKIIDRWQELENLVSSRPAIDPMQVLNDPAAMRGLLLTYVEKVITLQATVDKQAPDVAALKRIANSDGRLTPTDAAKTLGIPPHKLFKWLDTNGWTYRRTGNAERVGYQAKIQAGYLEHKVFTIRRDDGTEKTISRCVITPAGLANLAKHFGLGDPTLF